MLNGIPVYSLVIDEFSEEDGISTMSIVEQPAVEKNFLLFAKHNGTKKTFEYSLNEEKRIITGVALRCDYPIYRNDGGKEYYITMDADVIRKMVYKFMRDMRIKNVNIDHDFGIDGVYLIESFFLDDKNRSGYPEFEDVAGGSWIVSYKVDNENVWSKIRNGELKGFSVELTANMIEDSKYSKGTKEITNLFKIIQLYECITKSKTSAG